MITPNWVVNKDRSNMKTVEKLMQNKVELIKKINDCLIPLRPYFKDDGGDIEVVDITDDMIVQVKLLGMCHSCPQSHMTLKAGVETTIKLAYPEIKSVVAV